MTGNERRKMEDLFIPEIARMESDSRLLSTHISILSAIFICWHNSGFREPFSIIRRKLMAYSKVASTAIYHKCMSELIAFMYTDTALLTIRIKEAWSGGPNWNKSD